MHPLIIGLRNALEREERVRNIIILCGVCAALLIGSTGAFLFHFRCYMPVGESSLAGAIAAVATFALALLVLLIRDLMLWIIRR